MGSHDSQALQQFHAMDENGSAGMHVYMLMVSQSTSKDRAPQEFLYMYFGIYGLFILCTTYSVKTLISTSTPASSILLPLRLHIMTMHSCIIPPSYSFCNLLKFFNISTMVFESLNKSSKPSNTTREKARSNIIHELYQNQ